jgi:ATP-dependent RNA helicase DDX20
MTRSSVQRYRTADIESSVGSFDDLLLPEPLVRALARAGYNKPSPVQSASIPVGCIGKDMIIQAKSGTGKTVVFATICLERVKASSGTPQVCLTYGMGGKARTA